MQQNLPAPYGSQPYPSANYSMFIAEIASTFNEKMLNAHLAKAANQSAAIDMPRRPSDRPEPNWKNISMNDPAPTAPSALPWRLAHLRFALTPYEDQKLKCCRFSEEPILGSMMNIMIASRGALIRNTRRSV